MSGMRELGKYLERSCITTETLTFEEIYSISGMHVGSDFMNSKRMLENYGFSVVKIDLKTRKVQFTRNAGHVSYGRGR